METEVVEYQCSDCGSTVLADDKVCKNCGASLEETINESPENKLESSEGKQIMADKCARQMLFGILWVIGGIVVTAVTYNAAASSPTGGRYFVAWGAVLFGIYDFFKGLFGWLKYKD